MPSDLEVTNEIRFAVVMYGGISLAIYMNGIAQELLHLVRSTARMGWENGEEGRFRFKEEDLAGTEPTYRRLAERLTPGFKKDGVKKNGVRFIIDIVSGTSAGGINGVFLAKALANGQSIDELEELWVREGDLAKLLNDGESAKGVNLPKPSKQKSLLNSDRMYCKLLEAFTGMDFPDPGSGTQSGKQTAVPHPELVEELDLYVTTTDIRGRVIPLRTSDRLVYERNYKWAFHFQYARPEMDPNARAAGKEVTNDFQLENNPFLAFAARCTSSFPFAFEPMCFNKVEELVPSCGGYSYQTGIEPWLRFFASGHQTGPESGELKSRSFGDGAYLDNKPFSYAIDTLAKRSSDLPSQRKLLYIEPAPDHPEIQNSRQRKEELTAPNALDNSLAALVTLPGYQPIREDLARINERNRTIRKVTDLIDGVSRQLEGAASLGEQTGKTIADLQAERGAAYASYALLRAADVTDGLANVIGKALNYEQESSYFFAVRCLVRAWREMFYERKETQLASPHTIPKGLTNLPSGTTLTAFLADFDLSYHIRWTRFASSQIDFLYVLDVRAIRRLTAMGLNPPPSLSNPEDPGTLAFLAELRRIKKPIDDNFRVLRSTARHLHDTKMLQDRLNDLSEALLDRVLGLKKKSKDDAKRGTFAPRLQEDDNNRYVQNAVGILTDSEDAKETVSKLNDIAETIRAQVRGAIERKDSQTQFQPPAAGGTPKLAYDAAMLLYKQFPEYDSALFPLIYGTDVGELAPVDIIRISPEDATCIVDEMKCDVRKLKGTWLGHFGAFVDGRWRRSDILWGRLDAAERLIRSLLPGDEAKEFVRDAHDSILKDLIQGSQVDVAQGLADAAFARASGRTE